MKQSFENMSIKIKIFIYLIGFCSLLLILLWLFQVYFLDSFYKSIKTSEIKNASNTIAGNINSPDFDSLANEISSNYDIFIQIISEDGIVEYASGPFRNDGIMARMPVVEREQFFLSTKKNGADFTITYFRDEPQNRHLSDRRPVERAPMRASFINEVIVLSKVITDDNGQSKLVMLNSVISPVDATVNTITVQLYYITGFMLFFSVVLAVLISGKVSKPIISINESAKILATGNYETAFDGNGYKEIKELSDTMNYAAKELSKVDNLRKELIANISHDLRTPLTLISGYAEAMRDLPNENTPENAQVIIDETKRLTSLVSDVLDISKLQLGYQNLNLSDFNITASIKKEIERFSELVKNNGYTIQFIFDREVEVTADESCISQAFYNLLINAVNFSGDDKAVIVRQTTEDNNGIVKIEVIDNGEGISEESLPYIWERYYRSEKSHKRAIAGSGIGLSIVKSIIDLHGGKYGVTSRPGQGSVFWFSIDINQTKTLG